MDIFTILFYQPIYNLLVVFYRLFSENLGLSIILVALISRLITLPFTLRQAKMVEKSREMSEKIKGVKEKHKGDKEKIQQESMKIQSEYLPSQLAGCLPLIVQFILLINIYHVISDIILKGITSFNAVAYPFVTSFDPNYTLNTSFFGLINLTSSASKLEFSNPAIIPYLVIIALVGVTQYYSMKITMPIAPAPKKPKEEKKKGTEKGKNPASDDFSEILQQSTRQTMLLFPLMITFLSYSLPTGLSLYWIAQSTFVIIQQSLIKRRKANKELKAKDQKSKQD